MNTGRIKNSNTDIAADTNYLLLPYPIGPLLLTAEAHASHPPPTFDFVKEGFQLDQVVMVRGDVFLANARRFTVRKDISKARYYNKPVNEVTKGEPKRFMLGQLSSGLAVSNVIHIKNVLRGIFKEAIDDEVIDRNPSHIVSQ